MKSLRLSLAAALTASFTALTAVQAAEILDAKKVVPEFVAMGLKPKVTKLVDPRFKELSYDEDKYYLDVRFGKITPEQFKSLKAYFGNVTSVPYVATREYDILDFVQPAMQAVANQTFEPVAYDTEFIMEKVDFSDENQVDEFIWGMQKSGLSSFTNCWNTTMEITKLRHPKSDPRKTDYVLYWPGRWQANEELKDSKYSDPVKPEALQTGDVLLVKVAEGADEEGMVQHTAIVLTKNLLFEKTDAGDNDPYRISLREDVLAKYKKVFEGSEIFAYRRFNGAGKEPLPSPKLGIDEKEFKPWFLKALKKANPLLKIDHLTSGCETGLGGGCNLTYIEAHPAKVILNPRTGRGILKADQAVLKRFKALKGI